MTESTRTLETLELVGGALCLDFINTINSRRSPEHDYLVEYSDVVKWANKAGVLSPAQSNRLRKRAYRNAQGTESALLAALTLRDLLYRLFSRVGKGSKPYKKDMEVFAVFYGESISRGQLVKSGTHYQTAWKVDEALDAVLWPIIHSAAELLLSEELTHVKECPGCGWLFLDTSRNQSRRWCSMNTCGARDKMRRYHKRRRAG
ncbi:MAG TPA: ABATE domain-containing protein [Anaerolineales bacterium]